MIAQAFSIDALLIRATFLLDIVAITWQNHHASAGPVDFKEIVDALANAIFAHGIPFESFTLMINNAVLSELNSFCYAPKFVFGFNETIFTHAFIILALSIDDLARTFRYFVKCLQILGHTSRRGSTILQIARTSSHAF